MAVFEGRSKPVSTPSVEPRTERGPPAPPRPGGRLSARAGGRSLLGRIGDNPRGSMTCFEQQLVVGSNRRSRARFGLAGYTEWRSGPERADRSGELNGAPKIDRA